jgi:hypothetical protein
MSTAQRYSFPQLRSDIERWIRLFKSEGMHSTIRAAAKSFGEKAKDCTAILRKTYVRERKRADSEPSLPLTCENFERLQQLLSPATQPASMPPRSRPASPPRTANTLDAREKLAQYCIHVNTSAPMPAGLVAHVECVIKKPRTDEEKSNFAVKIHREAEAAAVVLIVVDWPIITSRAVCICAYVLGTAYGFGAVEIESIPSTKATSHASGIKARQITCMNNESFNAVYSVMLPVPSRPSSYHSALSATNLSHRVVQKEWILKTIKKSGPLLNREKPGRTVNPHPYQKWRRLTI